MKRFWRGFSYAGQGIAYVLRTQRNMRIHCGVAALVIVGGVFFRIQPLEWALIFVCIGLVFSAEMINTVAEMAVDMLTQRRHPLAKAAKDVGAGAVLVAASSAVVVGAVIFGPRLWALLFVH